MLIAIKLQALRKLFIHGKRLRLTGKIYGLVCLPNLQEMSFKGSRLDVPDDTTVLMP